MTIRVLSEHRGYLADTVRNRAYEAVLARVAPGSVVLDLGCGTGVWGLVALRHGARRVYAVDSSGMIDWAAAVARANGADGRIIHVRGSSTEIALPEPVDVVVADQLGPFVLEGDGIEVLADAARRHLRPGGTLVPSRVDLWAALASTLAVEEMVEFWAQRPLGLDFAALGAMAAGNRFYLSADPSTFRGDPVLVGSVEPATVTEKVLELGASLGLGASGTANSLVGWFEASLAPGIVISNGPPGPARIDRECVALPLWPALSWGAASTCEIELTARLGSSVLAWSVSVAGQRRRSNTLAGSVAGADDIRLAMARAAVSPPLPT